MTSINLKDTTPIEATDQVEPKETGVRDLEDLFKRAKEAREKAKQFLRNYGSLDESLYIPSLKASADPFERAIDTYGVQAKEPDEEKKT